MSKPTVNKSGGKIDAIQSELDATTNVLRENMCVPCMTTGWFA
jgi:hypothetical protein